KKKKPLRKSRHRKDTSAGGGWFHMAEAEMTPELRRDLQVTQTHSRAHF
ncbi:unnamed protein product, partial [Discosporangium mesarthrocarpum]